jgi:hypothetical protein
MSVTALVQKQNRDGGWPYVRGNSWTEPTAYAVMATLAAGDIESAHRGLAWLRRTQRPDGGWAPQPGVEQSTWVTGLAALLPREVLGSGAHQGAIQWLMGTTGKESTVEYRVRQWLLGNSPAPEVEFPGWPWVPGAAAWVGPTSIAILALDKQAAHRTSVGIRERVSDGRKFLMRRMCSGGGWNHGSAKALGYDSRPYPETTGMALAALRGVTGPQVELAVGVARQFLGQVRSAEAVNWLRFGLRAHAQLPAGYDPPEGLAYRTISEASLNLLAGDAVKGHEFFWV